MNPPGDELAHLDYWIPAGLELIRFKEDPDLFRAFQIIGREGLTAYAEHRSGAMLVLSLDLSERVVQRSLVQGKEAEILRNRYAYSIDPDLHHRLVHTLQRGVPAEVALQRLFGPRLLTLGHLDIRLAPDGAQARSYRLPGGALLDVRLHVDGRLASFEVVQGEAAAWKLEHEHRAPWTAPDARRDMLQAAQTWGEALLVVRMDGGKPELAREDWSYVPTRTAVLGSTPEGPKCWRFVIADRRPLDPLDLGEGVSEAFDPADALLFASGVQRSEAKVSSGNPTFDRALAAAAVRKALRTIPEGEEHVPERALLTTVSRWMLARQPERFTRTSMNALVASLQSVS